VCVNFDKTRIKCVLATTISSNKYAELRGVLQSLETQPDLSP